VVFRLVVIASRAGGRLLNERPDPVGGAAQPRRVKAAFGHGLGQPRVAQVVRPRHGQVQARGDGGDAVGDRAPVGDDDALVAPLVPQHLGEQPVVLARVHAVDLVVSAHHGPRPRLGDDSPEGAEVHFAQRPLVEVGADPHPVGLLAVDRVVLERGADVPALQAVDPRGREHPGEQRVLGEVLEVPAAERAALEVDARPEQDRDVHRTALVAEGLAHPPQQVRVPGRGGGHGRGKAGGRLPAQYVVWVHLQAHAVRPVGDGDGGQARGLDRRGVPRIAAAGQGRLLGDGELGRHARFPSAGLFLQREFKRIIPNEGGPH